ncbi:hypothetical protein ACHAW5_010645 [Stephanodiscus triporus]|uniref:Uncharacterized protein n=1 Tax=Stephanodiscus triporus TaxID=2934178 RepID=A0ABD3QD50_9STRA
MHPRDDRNRTKHPPCVGLALLLIASATRRTCRCEAFTFAPPSPLLPATTEAPRPPPRRRRPASSSSAWPRQPQPQRLPQRPRQQLGQRHLPLVAVNSSPPASNYRGGGGEERNNIHYVRPYLRQLVLLCRPVNFPVVALFHVLGAHQAVQLWRSTMISEVSSSSSSTSLLLSLLVDPSMLVVLLSLLLVTSTSMITNDYYDARDGVDSPDDPSHPLARGRGGGGVPLSVAKVFDSYLYASLLLSSAFVPGAASRLMVLGGAIITYLYTVHLKPRTWIKNLSCAALVGVSPVTSGLAAWHVLCDVGRPFSSGGSRGRGGVVVDAIPWFRILRSPLSFLVLSLFAGIMGREILMDITDCEGDARAGIETVPVKYGKRVASGVALGCSFVSAISACGASLIPWIKRLALVGGGGSVERYNGMPGRASLTALIMTSGVRKVLLSVAGSGMLARRTFAVWKTNGEDAKLADRAIDESLISVLLVLASFL